MRNSPGLLLLKSCHQASSKPKSRARAAYPPPIEWETRGDGSGWPGTARDRLDGKPLVRGSIPGGGVTGRDRPG